MAYIEARCISDGIDGQNVHVAHELVLWLQGRAWFHSYNCVTAVIFLIIQVQGLLVYLHD